MLTPLIRKLLWTNRNAFILLGALSFFGEAKASPPSNIPVADLPTLAESDVVTEQKYRERLIQVDINGQQLNKTVMVLEDRAGQLYLWSQDLFRWRFRPVDPGSSIDYQGEKYFPLSGFSGVLNSYDPKTLTLLIEVPPGAFSETVRTTQVTNGTPPLKPAPGGFFNYDLLAAQSAGLIQRSGQFELGYFNCFGVGTGNVLAGQAGGSPGMTRLDTTWATDFPEKLKTLHLGDAINVPGSWGRSVRFGGVQFGTNFGTQPGFVTLPLQSATGQAVLPSTVDVFINNALVSRQSVPPGPFSISNLPVITGAGEVRLVVRDLLGREQLVNQPFYASQSLLREGLENYSSELGFIRDNFGINSNDYGRWLGTGTYRRGLNDRLTGEIHAEAMRSQVTMGAGGDVRLNQLGTLGSHVAMSRSNLNSGVMLLAGIDRQSQRWSFGARTQSASSGFSQVGLQPPQLPPLRLSSFNLSYAAHSGGAAGLAYVTQYNRGAADSRLATLSYNIALGKTGTFTFSALRNFTGSPGTSIFAILSISLNASTSLSVSSQSARGGNVPNSDELTATLQRNLPAGEGYGYRLQKRTDGSAEASLTGQNNIGTYAIDTALTQGSSATRLNASGGMALLGNEVFLSRRIDQSFAVVRIPDYPGVRILADNQPAGRTNRSGSALIPRLRAYDVNVISIDQRDLPLDADIGTLKLEAVPYFRSGVEVRFPIKHSRGATLTIQLDDGKPLPLGAAVQEVGKSAVYTVGYDGEVYVLDLDPATRLYATWNNQICEFEVLFSASTDPLPDLGIFICKGVKP